MMARKREAHFRDIAFTIGTRICPGSDSLVEQGEDPLRRRSDRLTLVSKDDDELGTSLLDLEPEDVLLDALA